jgi:hypothetical protein
MYSIVNGTFKKDNSSWFFILLYSRNWILNALDNFKKSLSFQNEDFWSSNLFESAFYC